jgi:nucleotide-binding universal stress UspA family protein
MVSMAHRFLTKHVLTTRKRAYILSIPYCLEHYLMGSIIVAIDFSSVTELLVNAAVDEAHAFHDDLYFIHVAEPDPDFVGFDPGPHVVRDQIAAKFHKEHLRLQELSARTKSMGFNSTALLLQGPVVDTLVEQGTKLKARMLIAGSHGHGRIHDVLMGSTTSYLIRQASVPVLVIPARK